MIRSETKALPFHARTSVVQRLVHALSAARARRRDRQLLSRLDAHLLRDIGLSPDEARSEAVKPFWRA